MRINDSGPRGRRFEDSQIKGWWSQEPAACHTRYSLKVRYSAPFTLSDAESLNITTPARSGQSDRLSIHQPGNNASSNVDIVIGFLA